MVFVAWSGSTVPPYRLTIDRVMYNCKAWSMSFSLLNFADEFQYLWCFMMEIFVAAFVSVYLHIGIYKGKLKQHT